MPVYRAPLRDMRFILHELFPTEPAISGAGQGGADPEVVDAVLEEAAKLCEEVLAPLNRQGDEDGCRFEAGEVRTPPGFREAYRQFAEGGWTGLACDPAYGGQGLSPAVDALLQEMICSTNLAFGIYPGLSHGAYNALHQHGSESLKEAFLPALVAGRWSGTMCLTEPHCGTDLGLVRTRAEPRGDGGYGLTGTKIFISAGEHDLTENILHLVLARTPDAPPGVKGISLFLVPKFLLRQDGAPRVRNAVVCGSIEHKMGINGSATCTLHFDGATGYLVGELNRGLRHMFTMMNMARLAVGIQGLGLAEAAYQGAVAYARERLQGRAPGGARHPDRPADPILVHPDVRRMLLTMRAWIEGSRALAAWIASRSEIAARHPDAAEREAATDLMALLTPVAKAFCTDVGFEAASLGVQVYGGHGYIREHGMEQLVRDARITQIYEGTNGIQALDLVARKLPAHGGRALRRFFHPVQAYIEARRDRPELAAFIAPLDEAFRRLQRATAWLARQGLVSPDDAAAGASEYLRLFALVALAYLWCRMAEVSLERLASGTQDRRFYQAKVDTARFYVQRLLPQTGALYAVVLAGGESMMVFDDEAF